MEFTTFVRKPFVVEAIEVTDENIEQLAELIGELRHKENGAPYISVNRRHIVQDRVYTGFWITKMGGNIRCYSSRIFTNEFVRSNSDIEAWVSYLNNSSDESEVPDEFVQLSQDED